METYGGSADFRNNLTFIKEPEDKNMFYTEYKNLSSVNGLIIETTTSNKIDSKSVFLSNDCVKKETVDSSKIVGKEELEFNSKWIIRKDLIEEDETYSQPGKLFIMDGLMMGNQTSNKIFNNNTFLLNESIKMEPVDNSRVVVKKEIELNREFIIKRDHSVEETSSQPEKPFIVNGLTIESQTVNKSIDNTSISNNCVKMEDENHSKTDMKKELDLHTELIIKDHLTEKKTQDDGMDPRLVTDITELKQKAAVLPAFNVTRKQAYQCPVCPFKTNFIGRFTSHMGSTHRIISEAYRCGQCGFQAFSKLQLRKHECSGNILFACIICEFTGENKVKLSEHIKSAHHMICCPYCLYYSYSEIDLSMHLKVYHPLRRDDSSEAHEKGFECKQCHFKAENKRYFQLHVSIKHVESEKKQLWFKCPHCDDYEVVNEDALDNHILRNHTSNVKLYTCVYCKFDTTNENLFRNHVESRHQPRHKAVFYFMCKKEEEEKRSGRIKTNQILLRCPGCLFNTRNEDTLAYHVSFNHKGNFCVEFKCHHCKFKSNDKFGLFLHKCRETMSNYSFAYFLSTFPKTKKIACIL